jgi:N utilization substance protein B
MTTRHRAREIVLQLLYEDDLNKEQNRQVADQFLVSRLLGHNALILFARDLLTNIRQHRKQIDAALAAKAANWSVRRMSAIDRNILRLAAYEILMTVTPGPVVINEAIQLAKQYGDRNSGQFVNGVLDRLMHDAKSEGESPEVSITAVADSKSCSQEDIKPKATGPHYQTT